MSTKIDVSSNAVTFQCNKLLQISHIMYSIIPPDMIDANIQPNIINGIVDFINALSKDRDKIKKELVLVRQDLTNAQIALNSINEWVENNMSPDIE